MNKAEIVTRAVLAGAYLKHKKALDSCLTHAVEIDGAGEPLRVLCKGVQVDNLCDVDEPGGPTCKACARRLAREGAK